MGVHGVVHWRERVKDISIKNARKADLNKQNLQTPKVLEFDVEIVGKGMEHLIWLIRWFK